MNPHRTRARAPLALAAVLALLSGGCPPTAQPDATLENAALRIVLSGKSGAFHAIVNKATGQNLTALHDANDGTPPWRVVTTPTPFLFPSETRAFTSVTVQKDPSFPGGEAANLSWTVSSSLTVTARVELLSAADEATTTASLLNTGSQYGAALDYPILEGVGDLKRPGRDARLLSSTVGGLLWRNPFDFFEPDGDPGIASGDYPAPVGATVQTMAYFTDGVGGFQLSTRDPNRTIKNFVCVKNASDAALTMRVRHRSWDLAPGSDIALDYPVAIGALTRGDWYEAAEKYRDWATAGTPWVARGRLQDRVQAGDAAAWIAQDAGFTVMGLPASVDASAWIDAFAAISPHPVFYLFPHDWAAWAGASAAKYQALDALSNALGLGSFREIPLTLQWFAFASIPRTLQSTPAGLSHFAAVLGGTVNAGNQSQWQQFYDLVREDGPWLAYGAPQASFSPEQFHPANLGAISASSARFAAFEFDHLYYGADLDAYGIFTPALRDAALGTFNGALGSIWMDPATTYWRDARRARDVSLVANAGADALYYDITPVNPVMFASDRTDRGRPRGEGRALMDDYEEFYEYVRQGATAAAGAYTPLGGELVSEPLISMLDYAMVRVGGHVQGDLEAEPLREEFIAGDVEEVPLFPFVYHEYGPVLMDGWTRLGNGYGGIFYWIAAKTLLRGALLEVQYDFAPTELFPGMTGPGVQVVFPGALYEDATPESVDPAKAAFLGDVARVRAEFGVPYLSYGRMERPLSISSAVPNVVLDWFHPAGGFIIRRPDESGVVTVPQLVHTMWTNTETGSAAAFFANLGASGALPVSASVRLADYGLPSGTYSARRVSLAGQTPLAPATATADYPLSISLGPREIAMVEFAP